MSNCILFYKPSENDTTEVGTDVSYEYHEHPSPESARDAMKKIVSDKLVDDFAAVTLNKFAPGSIVYHCLGNTWTAYRCFKGAVSNYVDVWRPIGVWSILIVLPVEIKDKIDTDTKVELKLSASDESNQLFDIDRRLQLLYENQEKLITTIQSRIEDLRGGTPCPLPSDLYSPVILVPSSVPAASLASMAPSIAVEVKVSPYLQIVEWYSDNFDLPQIPAGVKLKHQEMMDQMSPAILDRLFAHANRCIHTPKFAYLAACVAQRLGNTDVANRLFMQKGDSVPPYPSSRFIFTR